MEFWHYGFEDKEFGDNGWIMAFGYQDFRDGEDDEDAKMGTMMIMTIEWWYFHLWLALSLIQG